jgi:hypothetical protein
MSFDADHWLEDLSLYYGGARILLESADGWTTDWAHEPVAILGHLNGVKASVWEMTRPEPLETVAVETQRKETRHFERRGNHKNQIHGRPFKGSHTGLPGSGSSVRKSGFKKKITAIKNLDRLYPSRGDISTLRLLQVRLSGPQPGDLHKINLVGYKSAHPKWQKWDYTANQLNRLAKDISDSMSQNEESLPWGPRP